MTRAQIEQIKEMGIFDFLAREGYTITKEEMRRLFMEYAYAVYDEDKATNVIAEKVMVEEFILIEGVEE